MKYKIITIITLCTLMLSSCQKPSSGDSSSKSKDETVAYATKIDLFNALEDMIKELPKKKYTDTFESLNEIFKLSNKSGFVSDPKDEPSTKYVTDLNELTAHVHNESKIQKERQVSFDYQQSQLKILASIASQGASEGGQQEGQSKEESSSGGSGEGGGGSSSGMGDKGGSSGSSESGSEGDQSSSGGEEKKEDYVIPEQELLTKYPELVLTKKDSLIYDLAIDLLGYVTKITLDTKPDDEMAMTNREKYLLYKINALSKIDQNDSAKDFLLEAQNNWSKLYIKVPEKEQQDAITLNALLKNIESSLSFKNSAAVQIQATLAIELIDELTSKMKSES